MSGNSNPESNSGANGASDTGVNNSANYGYPPQMHQQMMYAVPQHQQYYSYPQQGAMYGSQGDMYYAQQYYEGYGAGAASNDNYEQDDYDNYEQDDYDNLDEIDKEMNKASLHASTEDEEESAFKEMIQSERRDESHQKSSGGDGTYYGGRGGGGRGGGGRGGGGSGSFLPAGATPQQNGVLSPHAAEFWFPECRNCPCCKGFKHGCPCRIPATQWAPAVDTCTDPRCLDPNAPPPPEPVAPPAGAAHVSSYYTVEAPSASSSATAAPGDMCKFEQSSPGGCRFGAACRFQHMTGDSSGASAGMPSAGQSSETSSGGRSNNCTYFQRGNCQYGDSCRYGHF